MTKQELAKNIIEHIDNSNFVGENPLQGVLSYLDLLIPKNPEKFCKIGYLHQKSDIENCWK